MAILSVPSQLRGLAGGHASLDLPGATLSEVLRSMDERAPMLRSQLFEPDGEVRQFVGLFLDNEPLSEVGDGALPVRSGAQLVAVMAVAGG